MSEEDETGAILGDLGWCSELMNIRDWIEAEPRHMTDGTRTGTLVSVFRNKPDSDGFVIVNVQWTDGELSAARMKLDACR